MGDKQTETQSTGEGHAEDTLSEGERNDKNGKAIFL